MNPSYIELAAVGFSLGAVYLTTKRSIWCWPISIVAVLLSAQVYYTAGLFAEMGLQSYYLGAAIVGWVSWHRQKQMTGTVMVRRMTSYHWWSAVAISILSGVLLGYVLWLKTKAPIAFVDSLIATSSLVATWFMVKRYLENWLIWVVIDTACLFVYIHKELYSFAGLFMIYTLLAIQGYFDWKKEQTSSA